MTKTKLTLKILIFIKPYQVGCIYDCTLGVKSINGVKPNIKTITNGQPITGIYQARNLLLFFNSSINNIFSWLKLKCI